MDEFTTPAAVKRIATRALDPTRPGEGVFLHAWIRVDLLFMIDNSPSMADKQALLSLAVPDLVGRLVNPVCIDSTTFQQVGMRSADGSCGVGELDFEPVNDIHIGIISSSLGGHGSSGVCDQPDSRKTFSHNDDKGHLLTRGPESTSSIRSNATSTGSPARSSPIESRAGR